jgi:hypothetical protein
VAVHHCDRRPNRDRVLGFAGANDVRATQNVFEPPDARVEDLLVFADREVLVVVRANAVLAGRAGGGSGQG